MGRKEGGRGRKGGGGQRAERSGAFLAFAEPPYWMRISSAVFWSTAPAIQPRIALCVSCACSGLAVTPVPIAHTGSYAITTRDLSSRLWFGVLGGGRGGEREIRAARDGVTRERTLRARERGTFSRARARLEDRHDVLELRDALGEHLFRERGKGGGGGTRA